MVGMKMRQQYRINLGEVDHLLEPAERAAAEIDCDRRRFTLNKITGGTSSGWRIWTMTAQNCELKHLVLHKPRELELFDYKNHNRPEDDGCRSLNEVCRQIGNRIGRAKSNVFVSKITESHNQLTDD